MFLLWAQSQSKLFRKQKNQNHLCVWISNSRTSSWRHEVLEKPNFGFWFWFWSLGIGPDVGVWHTTTERLFSDSAPSLQNFHLCELLFGQCHVLFCSYMKIKKTFNTSGIIFNHVITRLMNWVYESLTNVQSLFFFMFYTFSLLVSVGCLLKTKPVRIKSFSFVGLWRVFPLKAELLDTRCSPCTTAASFPFIKESKKLFFLH